MVNAADDRQPAIVLEWLVRLRWFAVAGQVAATFVAVVFAGWQLPLGAMSAVIALTAVTNLAALLALRRGTVAAWIAPALSLLDVVLLTALLYLSGGPSNPFCTLYLIHIAMAVFMLGPTWKWVVVTTVAVLFAFLFVDSIPLHRPGQPPAKWVMPVGLWTAVVLTGGLNAYFIGRMRAALRDREEQLLRAGERAARNEHLAILSTLSAGAAHELGTPLGTIAVIARELEVQSRQLDEGSGLAEDARLIRQEVDRCRRILDRMRVDSIELLRHNATPIDLSELVKQVVDALKPGEESRLKVDCDPNLQTVLGPLHTLQQAVSVLVRNAFDASPKDGLVELRIRRDNGHVVFAVEDHGSGMSEETLRRAGQPFFTTKSPGQGMGLGLFLVRLVAERAGGTFRLESKPGVGTRSELHLPETPPGSSL